VIEEEKQHVLGEDCSLSAMPIFVFGTGTALLENSNLPQLRLCQTDSTRSRPLDWRSLPLQLSLRLWTLWTNSGLSHLLF